VKTNVQAVPLPVPAMNTREFLLLSQLIEAETGIHLPERKRALVEARLSRRLRALGLPSFSAYYRRVTAGDQAERMQMIDALCTTQTQFFREPRHFRFLEQRYLPQLLARAAAGRHLRSLRVWSAGCSSGEEPYSIAMLLAHLCPPESGWQLDVLATDLCSSVLARARAGEWPADRAAEIPALYRDRFMEGGRRGEPLRAGAELRRNVRFESMNLNQADYPVRGPFDLIFCRNVLIYFTAAGRARVIDRLLDRLDPGGVLFVGHAETLNGLSRRVVCLEPTVYALVAPASRGRSGA
jgi:chemotaxis protein methyltransferase CheR